LYGTPARGWHHFWAESAPWPCASRSAARSARADQASTAAIITAVGAIVSTLIYDSNRRQYYYEQSNRRYYVSNEAAQQWYQRQDPRYFNEHRSDFRNHPGRFDRGFRNSHHGHNPHQPHH